ncbi:hypothetical protein K493DRAFT_295613 [Basidiobolus meristosporus CBS 931.73]|uniref:Tet-like 2OG-Fe(II) oxygenase domain-containing protein n=1 Tax=Basidiobolus meristosporus CBS 931.73 TaxID=1314790 RepID=A0A1Y1ZAB8_9FUNG|nr:hypothetical protein K493DRAFT_295613 [Basidiobolus meristosporus CBS 931.73]|eukprot:ORY07220.1 hypothetical protein K493DRAFT_295613 [Basidiobolus meristosporus CBS 931.73]
MSTSKIDRYAPWRSWIASLIALIESNPSHLATLLTDQHQLFEFTNQFVTLDVSPATNISPLPSLLTNSFVGFQKVPCLQLPEQPIEEPYVSRDSGYSKTEDPIWHLSEGLTNFECRFVTPEDKSYCSQFEDVELHMHDTKGFTILERTTFLLQNDAIVFGVIQHPFSRDQEDFALQTLRSIPGYRNNLIRKSKYITGQMFGVGYRSPRGGNISGISLYSIPTVKKSDTDHINRIQKDAETLAALIQSFVDVFLPDVKQDWHKIQLEYQTPVLHKDTSLPSFFATKDYSTKLHVDNDRSQYAIGVCFLDGDTEEQYFIIPKYKVAVPLNHNVLWFWRPCVDEHGTTSVLSKPNGHRYTAVFQIPGRLGKKRKHATSTLPCPKSLWME